MQRRQPCGEHAVHLLGKRLPHVSGAESGFDVGHGHAGVEAGQRAAEGCGGISLDEDHAGFFGLEHTFEASENAAG